MYMKYQEKLESLPALPGVYFMKDEKGGVLYIGKAQSLRDRVRSYFHPSAGLTLRIVSMVRQVEDFEYIVTKSNLEALILENNLIKKYRPRYNVILRDDKNYPYLRLNLEEGFPRLTIVRRIKDDGALYFGPYVPTNALRETLKVVNKVFPLATCKINIDGKAKRPCLQYEMGRCLGPCVGNIGGEQYRKIVEEVRLFLEGKNQELVRFLKGRMEEEAERLNFEEAGRLRDRLRKVEKVRERQRIISTGLENQDVIGIAQKDGCADIQVLFIRGGMVIGRKDFFFHKIEDISDKDLCASFIEQFYMADRPIPDEIIISVDVENDEIIREWLAGRKKGRVEIIHPQRGKKLSIVRLAEENAQVSLSSHMREMEVDREILLKLKETLRLKGVPNSIEAFDVSNISGHEAVSSMVSFQDGRPDKNEYRHFRIRSVESIDDYAMMREVLTRRYAKGGELPDLIMVDGGKGQLGVAMEVLKELRIEGIDVIALAKERAGGGETVLLPERVYIPGDPKPITFLPDSPVTHLLQRIRDESHRFAITYHRKIRGKKVTTSVLEGIPGIGRTRIRALLRYFGSIDRIAEATEEELLKVPKMTRRAAGDVLKGMRGGIG